VNIIRFVLLALATLTAPFMASITEAIGFEPAQHQHPGLVTAKSDDLVAKVRAATEVYFDCRFPGAAFVSTKRKQRERAATTIDSSRARPY
jgi:hypothetical protein